MKKFALEKVFMGRPGVGPGSSRPSPRERIQAAQNHARAKHPAPWRSTLHALAVLLEEVGEVAWALVRRDRENLREELAQVAAVCWRWLERMDKEDAR